MDVTLDVGGVDGHEFWGLPHIAAHAGEPHLGAREIELHGINASTLDHLSQFYPLFLALAHDAGYDDLRRIILLQPVQNVEVHVDRVLAQLLHVTEAIEVAIQAIAVYGIESGRNLLDFLQADGLIVHATPPRLKGTCHHLVVGTHCRGCQKERILAVDAAKLNIQVRIGRSDVIRMDAAQHLLQSDGPVVVYASLLSALQVGIAAVCHPAHCGLMVVKTDGTDSPRGVSRLTGFGTGCILTQQASARLFVDVDLFLYRLFVFVGLF